MPAISSPEPEPPIAPPGHRDANGFRGRPCRAPAGLRYAFPGPLNYGQIGGKTSLAARRLSRCNGFTPFLSKREAIFTPLPAVGRRTANMQLGACLQKPQPPSMAQ